MFQCQFLRIKENFMSLSLVKTYSILKIPWNLKLINTQNSVSNKSAK